MPYKLFDVQQAADYLHLEPKDVRDLAVRGELPCEHQGGDVVFRQHELKTWCSRRILDLAGRHLDDYHSRGLATVRQHDLSDHGHILEELVHDEGVACDLAARTRASMIREMVAVAEATGLLYDPGDLLQGLSEREELCPTGIPGGAALLHPRQHDPYMFEDSFVCIGRTDRAIPFGSPDGRRTDLFFLVCCQDDRIHLHALARICLLCQEGNLLSALRAAANPEEMHRETCRIEAVVVDVPDGTPH